MEQLMLVTTIVDLAAVAALGWLVLRTGRARADAVAEQQATLEALRGDLAELVRDAEERTRTLDEALAAREERLRGLLVELGRHESGRGGRAGRDAAWSAELGRSRGGERGSERGSERAAERPARVDPAEARLLRDLEVRLPPTGRRA
jgi:hypothetical protein